MNVNLFKRDSYLATRRERAIELNAKINETIARGAVAVFEASESIDWEGNNSLGVYTTQEKAEQAVKQYISGQRKAGNIYGQRQFYVDVIILDSVELRQSIIRFEASSGYRTRRVDCVNE